VTQTELAIQDELGWLFRREASEDYGIDALVAEAVHPPGGTGRID
jgi:hypothetical protein